MIIAFFVDMRDAVMDTFLRTPSLVSDFPPRALDAVTKGRLSRPAVKSYIRSWSEKLAKSVRRIGVEK
jgi:hypothetical protein